MTRNERNRQVEKRMRERNWSAWGKMGERQREKVKEYMRGGHGLHSAIMLVRMDYPFDALL